MHTNYDFTPQASRLLKAINQYKLTPFSVGGEESPDIDSVAEELKDFFSFADLELGHRINCPDVGKIDWWTIDLGQEHIPAKYEWVNQAAVTTSFAEALCLIMEEFDASHIYPDIQLVGNSINFFNDGKLIFSLKRVEFEQVSESLCKKVKEALKGIKYLGEEAQLTERLKKIPGLESLEDIPEHIPDWAKLRMVSMIDNFPKSMQDMLEERFELDIKHSLALEIVAQTFGSPNWNIFKSKHDEHKSKVYLPYAIDCTYGKNRSEIKFYRSNIEAIAGLIELGNKEVSYPGNCEIYRFRDEDSEDDDGLCLKLIKTELKNGRNVRHMDFMMLKAFLNCPTEEQLKELGVIDKPSLISAFDKANEILNVNMKFEARIKASDIRNKTKSIIAGDTLLTLSSSESIITLKSINGSNSGIRNYFPMPAIEQPEDFNGSNLILDETVRYEDNVNVHIEDAELIVHLDECTVEHSPLYTSVGRTVWRLGKLNEETVLKIAELTGVRITWMDNSKKEKYKAYIPKIFRA